ncbi:hypothetical protein RRG08_001622 [Elysia crispata]|uniref:Uncharacterized protein n=1 Tax=Elysia crispata TaxID=231223 RepID=A0AAE1AK60_9GAST|nr:hypothetical protein RRG08_001622 [Elysia crispata]
MHVLSILSGTLETCRAGCMPCLSGVNHSGLELVLLISGPAALVTAAPESVKIVYDIRCVICPGLQPFRCQMPVGDEDCSALVGLVEHSLYLTGPSLGGHGQVLGFQDGGIESNFTFNGSTDIA